LQIHGSYLPDSRDSSFSSDAYSRRIFGVYYGWEIAIVTLRGTREGHFYRGVRASEKCDNRGAIRGLAPTDRLLG
jgi:hypothetical protein